MAFALRKQFASSVINQLHGNGAALAPVTTLWAQDQHRHASSHAENTNTFIKEVHY